MLSVKDRVAIEALHRAWLDAELRGDSSAVLQLCTPTPVWLPPNEAPLCGSASILRWLGDQPHTAVLRIDIDELAVSGVGSFAWKLAMFRTTSKVQAVMPEPSRGLTHGCCRGMPRALGESASSCGR